jgi:hypothetical protein
MRLPNGRQAYIPPEKLHAYLLSETHAIGKAKAAFFRALGFNETNISLLERGLLTLAYSAPVQDTVSSPHGIKYVLEGVLEAPNGTVPRIRTVWILETGETRPRFVTAYPCCNSPGLAEERAMIHELDTIVLVRDLEAYGLTQGDVGAVVHSYQDGTTFEVEFVNGAGATIAVLTLSRCDIRPMQAQEILHVRAIAEVASLQ